MVGLSGPSGAGKSTVASMVISRVDVQAYFHRGVLWLPVGKGANGRVSSLMLRLAGMVYEEVLGKACRPPQKADVGVEPEDGVAYIREVLGEADRRLLVVADDVWEEEVLRELRKVGAWVLYTSRVAGLLGGAPLRLDQLQTEEAEAVLRGAAELEAEAHLPEMAHELIRRSEFIVMDLACVGRWGAVRGASKDAAWQRVLDRIEQTQESGGNPESGERLPWRTSVLRAGLGELALDNELNMDLYISLAVLPDRLAFGVEDVSALLYGEASSTSSESLENAAVVAANLERWAILTLEDGGRYRVHDLHADFVRERVRRYPAIRDRAIQRWQEHVSTVDALLMWSGSELADIWRTLAYLGGASDISRPYDSVLADLHSSDSGSRDALRRLGHFHYLMEDFEGAYEANAVLVQIEEEELGHDHQDVARALHNLAVCASEAGRTEEAQGLYERSLVIREKELGPDHPTVASALHHLGVCALEAGRTEDAERLHRRALGIREEKVGPDHPDVARSLHSIAVCTAQAGRIKEAEGLHRRALEIREKKLGHDHPEVAVTLHALGVCAGQSGRADEAEHLHRRALAIQEEKLGKDHPELAIILFNLGVGAWKAGRTEEAESLLRRALMIREKRPGTEQPDLAIILYNLGVGASKAGRDEEAERLHRRALAIREEKLGPDHPDVANILDSLGVGALNAGRIEEAERLHRRALDIREAKLGLDHPEVARTLHSLGVCAGQAGRIDEAEHLHRRALVIREEKLGRDHPDVAVILYNLGVCAVQRGRTDEAEDLLRRALDIQEEKLGGDHPDVARTVRALEVCAKSVVPSE